MGWHARGNPRTRTSPSVTGKRLYFWSFVVAILIFAVGAGISLYEGIQHVLAPHPLERPEVSYIVLGLAMIFEGVAWYFAFTEFSRVKGRWSYFEAVQRGKDPSMFVVLFEDSAAMLGLVVAFVGIFLGQITGEPRFDGAASIVIGLILAGTAVWLAYETKSLLIGEAANRDVVAKIRKLVGQQEAVEQVNEVLTMHMGPDFILVNLSVHFLDSLNAAALEGEIAALDRAIKEADPRVKRVFVEAEAVSSRRAP